jgi:hypothetical protein
MARPGACRSREPAVVAGLGPDRRRYWHVLPQTSAHQDGRGGTTRELCPAAPGFAPSCARNAGPRHRGYGRRLVRALVSSLASSGNLDLGRLRSRTRNQLPSRNHRCFGGRPIAEKVAEDSARTPVSVISEWRSRYPLAVPGASGVNCAFCGWPRRSGGSAGRRSCSTEGDLPRLPGRRRARDSRFTDSVGRIN